MQCQWQIASSARASGVFDIMSSKDSWTEPCEAFREIGSPSAGAKSRLSCSAAAAATAAALYGVWAVGRPGSGGMGANCGSVRAAP
eukprot:27404-Pleurochrysis_carterae.AAC.1